MSFTGSTGSSHTNDFAVDLLAVSLIAVVGIGFVIVGGDFGVTQVLLGVMLVLFAPGYALVSLLLPETATEPPGGLARFSAGRDETVPVTASERAVLSIGLSVILVPFIGFVLHYTQWGVGRVPMVVGIGLATIVLSGLAAIRRLRIPRDRRFTVFDLGVASTFLNWLEAPNDSRGTALNAVIVVGLVVAVAGIGLAAATATTGERHTELYLLAEDDETGELVADGYPNELTRGERVPLHVGIENEERRNETYTVVAQLQRLDGSDADATVIERSELERFEVALDHGETSVRRSTAEPQAEGDDVRLVYLLYVDDPPDQPSSENAYRSVHIWADVTSETTP